MVLVLISAPWLAAQSGTQGKTGRNQAPTSSLPNPVEAESKTVERLSILGVAVERDAAGRAYSIEENHGEMSDEVLRILPSFERMEWLEVSGGKVTPAGLAHLKGCRSLKRLYLHDLSLTDEALSFLADLTSLESLSLQRTNLNGDFLRYLSPAGPLSVLNLSGNRIVEKNLSLVARFKGLEVLALERTGVTGSGLALLKQMPKLNVLNISHCPVSDRDLELFVSMPNLRIVHAHGCSFEDTAMESIKDRLPMLAIFTQ
jgi:internalin A